MERGDTQLVRTSSNGSSKSRKHAHSLSSASPLPPPDRKARSSEPESSSENVERANISMPPHTNKTGLPRGGFLLRRPSRVSDSGVIHEDIAEGGPWRSSVVIDDPETTPTVENVTQSSSGTSMSSIAAAAEANQSSRFSRGGGEGEGEAHRLSFSSLYSLGSAIYSGAARSAGMSGPSSVAGSEPDAARSEPPSASTSLSINNSYLQSHRDSPGTSISTLPSSTTTSHPSQWSQAATARMSVPSGRSGSHHRKISGGTTGGSASPNSERNSMKEPVKEENKKPPIGKIGVCALDSKARSKPSRNILNRLISKAEFEVIIFGDKVILDEDVENWPICDFLICFFSGGFPLDKAIAYARLRKPFCVNDLPMQRVLWDRRLCLYILDNFNVPTPKRLEINRDGGPKADSTEFARLLAERTGVKLDGNDGLGGGLPRPKKIELFDDGDTLSVDGLTLTKPFVEKPVSGEDHNINVYYPKSQGGGGRRLFRKVNNKSSEKDETLDIPRGVLDEEGSYIYEQFLSVENAEDVKAYTVGTEYCHAETRKSPVVDGVVKRNPSGKEIRYMTNLSKEEQSMAARIATGFGQRVCGFDLLRAGDKSYVIDVNGWSFVKDNNEYYDKCASILKEMFLREKLRKEGRMPPPDSEVQVDRELSGHRKSTTGSHRQQLKSILRSPSLGRLRGHYHGNSSPEPAAQTTPITSPPTLERPSGSGTPATPIVQSELLPPPVRTDLPSSLPLSKSEGDVFENPVPLPASKAQWKLKGMVSVIRHADRTPKQKFKFTFHTKPFVDLLKGHQEEVLLIGEAALNSVIGAVDRAFEEGVEDVAKLSLLKTSLVKKGGWAGTKVQIKPMFRKRKKEEMPPKVESESSERPLSSESERPPQDDNSALAHDWVQRRSDSTSAVTLSRISAAENNLILDKLQLIIKWGGEPTHSARYQAQDLGENLRNELMLMNREALNDVSVFSSSERRSTTSAQIFASTFLNQTDLPPDFISIRKDLLDDSNAAKDEMDKVKKKLKNLLRAGNKAPPQFAWPENMPEPFLVVRDVVDLMKFHRKVMHENLNLLEDEAKNHLSISHPPSSTATTPGQSTNTPVITPGDGSGTTGRAQAAGRVQARWCSGEDADLFKERWEKLFEEFTEAEKVDPSKISELYDTMKFDALHNRQFLEWVFMPSSDALERDSPRTSPAATAAATAAGTSATNSAAKSSPSSAHTSNVPTPAETPRELPSFPSKSGPTESTNREKSSKDNDKQSPAPGERGTSLGHRVGAALRRRSEHAGSLAPPTTTVTNAFATSSNGKAGADRYESYFNLFRGVPSAADNLTGNHHAYRQKMDVRLAKLRELYRLCKVLFDYIGPQEYGIADNEKLEIGLLTSLPLLKEIVKDLEMVQASEDAKSFFYFTKESHIYTLLNCILEGGVQTKIERNAIPELDYLSLICFELYESQNATEPGEERGSFNYSIKITISPGCHTFDPLDVQLDSKHCIGFAPRRSLTAHADWTTILDTLRAKFHTVKLPKSFVAINLSEKIPHAFRLGGTAGKKDEDFENNAKEEKA